MNGGEADQGQYCIGDDCLCCQRLEFFIMLLLLQGKARTTEQRCQLIKRMEPLTEENMKLKEAMKLMEKNVQRA